MSNWSKEKLNRYIKEGRGSGIGKDYVPWTKTHEFSSKGRATRILGIKTGRIHHLHSDNQLRAFLMFEWSRKVTDIRECFPLLDAMEVIDDKENLQFGQFRDKESGEQLVLTTNFLLTVKNPDGSERYAARTVKDSSELARKITFEKLEIERRYWCARGIEWKVISDKQLPRQYFKNIEWVREILLDTSENEGDKEQLSGILLQYLFRAPDVSLNDVLKEFDINEGVYKGNGLYLFRYLIAKKSISIDMNKKFDTSLRIKDLLLREEMI